MSVQWLRASPVLGLMGLLYCAAGWPQAIPPIVEPGRAEERLKQPREPERVPREPVVAVESQAPAPPANADSIEFTLQNLAVDGVTVYPADRLIEKYRPLQGTRITLARLYAIAAELTARYRSDGYLLSSVVVPAQKIADG